MYQPWYVYIVECSDGTLYTGVSPDVEKRMDKHNSGKGAKYTRSRRPVRLVCRSGGMTKRASLRLERKIKKQRKDRKVAYCKEIDARTTVLV